MITGLREVWLIDTRVTTAGIERLQRAGPKVQFPMKCGTMNFAMERANEERRVRRQGLTGRLRLGWRSVVGER